MIVASPNGRRGRSNDRRKSLFAKSLFDCCAIAEECPLSLYTLTDTQSRRAKNVGPSCGLVLLSGLFMNAESPPERLRDPSRYGRGDLRSFTTFSGVGSLHMGAAMFGLG